MRQQQIALKIRTTGGASQGGAMHDKSIANPIYI